MGYTDKKDKVRKAKKIKYDIFIEEYLSNGFDASSAAIKAGYVKKNARKVAYELLNFNAYVKEKLQERAKILLDKKQITALKTLEEIEKIAFASIGDFVEIKNVKKEKDGLEGISQSVVIKENIDMSLIKKIKTDKTGAIELELYPKDKALDSLAKYSELAKEKEIKITAEDAKNVTINFVGK